MKAALFVPCFIDAFFPEVGIATLELLERLGVEVDYPLRQTCCGQPMANSGDQADAAAVEALFVENFKGYEYIVTPSGSCTHHVRDNFDAIPQSQEVQEVRANTYELVEFLHDILKVEDFPWAEFPHKVGIHNSCSSLMCHPLGTSIAGAIDSLPTRSSTRRCSSDCAPSRVLRRQAGPT